MTRIRGPHTGVLQSDPHNPSASPSCASSHVCGKYIQTGLVRDVQTILESVAHRLWIYGILDRCDPHRPPSSASAAVGETPQAKTPLKVKTTELEDIFETSVPPPSLFEIWLSTSVACKSFSNLAACLESKFLVSRFLS
jgi:hypothetical protein